MRKFSAAALGLLAGVPVLGGVEQVRAPSSQMEVVGELQAVPPVGGLRATTARLAGFPQRPSRGSKQLGSSVVLADFFSDKSLAKSSMVAPMGSAQQHIDRFAASATHQTGCLQKHVGGTAAGAAHRTSFLQLRNFQQLTGSNNQQHHTGPGPKSLATSWMAVPASTPRSRSGSRSSGPGTRFPSPASSFLTNAVELEREVDAASASSVAPTCESYGLGETQDTRSGDGWGWMAVADQCAESAVAAQFLSRNVGKPFCVLAASSEKVLGATADWLETAGVTWGDVLAANSILGIRSLLSPFSMSDSFEHSRRAREKKPAQLVRYLMRPDDAWDPVDATLEGLKLNRTPNRLAAPVEFRGQWHKHGGYHYTGSVGISRLVCKDKEGECPVAYLCHLRYKQEVAPQASTLDKFRKLVDQAARSAVPNANEEFLRQRSIGSRSTAVGSESDEMASGSVEGWSDDETTVGDGESGKDSGEDEDMAGTIVALQAMSLKRNREADAEEKAEHSAENDGRKTSRRRCEE